MSTIFRRTRQFLGTKANTMWIKIKIDNSDLFSDVLVVLLALIALTALTVFIALTAFTVLIAIVVVVIVVVVVVVIIVVEVDAAAVVVAVDKSSFRIANVVDYGEEPLYELQGLFSIRLDIRDKLRYIRL